ncbi:hypothetical protein Tdes44962_MAKER07004 [Teratosphaeria destructans]|uniref:Uncharacterized protein n=1 Tax=Teratosphaeria destructans TaxID=418781 RepID=A0A9W7W6S7_9PEZI|nr:hypothetical protein Tdes44962_MAKER07004 [Teratosphaeria destructans]
MPVRDAPGTRPEVPARSKIISAPLVEARMLDHDVLHHELQENPTNQGACSVWPANAAIRLSESTVDKV